MRTILNKIFFGAIFIFLSWKGLDGLLINLFHSSDTSLDILQLERSKKNNYRNVEIHNGIAGQTFVYYQSDSYSPVDIIYPLISHEQSLKLNQLKPISVRVLVRISNLNRNCVKNNTCIPIDSTAVNGIVKMGLENLSSNDIAVLESNLVKLDKNVILIESGERPIIWYWNLAMFIGGTIFGFAILKSFFRQASSLEEYWEKITEKAERQ